MAIVQAGQFTGNEAEAHKYLKGVVAGEPSSGMVRYAAYGDTGSLGPDDWSRLGLSAPAGVLAQQQKQLQMEAIQPSLESLRASIPETEARFGERARILEAEKEPLKQRYQSLLDDLTRRETRETETTQRGVTQEFGARGLLPTGGGFEQYLGQQLRPTQEFYAGQQKEVGLERESSLRELANMIAGVPFEEQQALRAINQAIADIQSGAATASVEQALKLYELQQQAQQQALDRALTERQVSLQERIAQQQAPERTALEFLKSGSTIYGLDPYTGETMKTIRGQVSDDGW